MNHPEPYLPKGFEKFPPSSFEYRFLGEDEIIQNGDEFWDAVYYKNACWNSSVSVGSRVGRMGNIYRRKLKLPRRSAPPNPGEEYRLLEIGECIEGDDECFNETNWIKTANETAWKTRVDKAGFFYRRKIAVETKSENGEDVMNQWIGVKDRLPEKGRDVFAINITRNVFGNIMLIRECDSSRWLNITHWCYANIPPVATLIPKKPEFSLKGYKAEISGDSIKFGCAVISLNLIRSVSEWMASSGNGCNRKIGFITLDSGVQILKEDIEGILQFAKDSQNWEKNYGKRD